MDEPIEQESVDSLDVPYFFTLDRYDQRRALESLIFASDDPLSVRSMHRILVLEDPTQNSPGQQELPLESDEIAVPEPERKPFVVPSGYFDELVDEINDDLEQTDRPFRIVKIAGGYQFATTPQHGQLVQRLLKARSRKRLTAAAMETLAIVAYRQPITKAEIEAIRGVNSSEVVNSLVEKQLVAMVGRSETVGKPLLYGTSDEFLRIFGLNSLSDLPKLREIDELIKTTTTLVDMDETLVIKTDHKTLRKQIAALLDAGKGASAQDSDSADASATSGAYWHHTMEHEAEAGLVDDPEPGAWEHDAAQESHREDATLDAVVDANEAYHMAGMMDTTESDQVDEHGDPSAAEALDSDNDGEAAPRVRDAMTEALVVLDEEAVDETFVGDGLSVAVEQTPQEPARVAGDREQLGDIPSEDSTSDAVSEHPTSPAVAEETVDLLPEREAALPIIDGPDHHGGATIDESTHEETGDSPRDGEREPEKRRFNPDLLS
jgi:segregation and condensation protein B